MVNHNLFSMLQRHSILSPFSGKPTSYCWLHPVLHIYTCVYIYTQSIVFPWLLFCPHFRPHFRYIIYLHICLISKYISRPCAFRFNLRFCWLIRGFRMIRGVHFILSNVSPIPFGRTPIAGLTVQGLLWTSWTDRVQYLVHAVPFAQYWWLTAMIIIQ